MGFDEMKLKMEIQSPVALSQLNDYVIEEDFNLDGVVFDPENQIVDFRFDKGIFEDVEVISNWLLFKRIRLPVRNHLIRFHNVEEYKVVDSEKIGIYDFLEISFHKRSSTIEISSNVPLKISMRVKQLHIELLQSPKPKDYQEFYSFL